MRRAAAILSVPLYARQAAGDLLGHAVLAPGEADIGVSAATDD